MKNNGIYYDIFSISGLIVLILVAFFYVYSIQNLLFKEVEYHLKEISRQFSQRIEERLESNIENLNLMTHEDTCFSKLTYEEQVKKLIQWKENSNFF